ncbi:MAG: hypothetical protein ABI614_06400 [Planctomycetota bacterium]
MNTFAVLVAAAGMVSAQDREREKSERAGREVREREGEERRE